jgi:pimeloyl-ACP methyl ester carboxylesterase
MTVKALTSDNQEEREPLTNKRFLICLAAGLALLLFYTGQVHADTQWPRVAVSKDGTPISYEVSGTGDPALVFVHGWSCDARYWRCQVPVFSRKNRVIVLDLAGPGHSGTSRTRYTMKAFGEDVQAVTEAAGTARVILIGHSMGGSVIAEAAALMPDRVIGLIGVDTLENIEYPLTREALDSMTAPMEKNFQAGCRQFVDDMILPETDPELREWILSDIAAASPEIALSAMNEMLTQYITGEAAAIFENIRIPVVTVNGDLWPVNHEANRRHMHTFDAIVLKNADHFLMMTRPVPFNNALEQAIIKVSARQGGM